eukprot:scaffold64779_cov18-Tisochrysis_lutea.AAC.1
MMTFESVAIPGRAEGSQIIEFLNECRGILSQCWSLRPFSQASSRASSRACSREFGHEAPPTSSVPCTRRSLDSAGVPLPRFPAQTSRSALTLPVLRLVNIAHAND